MPLATRLSSTLATLAVLSLSALAACPADEGNSCPAELIGEWQSVDAFPCPTGEAGCTYRHYLRLDATSFDWGPGDYTVAGDYRCEEDVVTGYMSQDSVNEDGETVEVEVEVWTALYDAETDVLALDWDGVTEPYAYERIE